MYSEFGELLFTHQGVSGPLILTASSCIPDKYMKQELHFEIEAQTGIRGRTVGQASAA